jgi:CRISPR-associated protein Cmr2
MIEGGQMRYVFICTIGPVQDFIKTARRSRDLWYGSWMLSELSKAAAKEIGNTNLVFPAPSKASDLDKESPLNVANKIVATVQIENPKEFGQEIKKAVQTRLKEMRDAAFDKVRGNLDTKERAEKQVDDLLEFYWVAVPLLNDKDYEKVRDRAEMLLAARKNTRNFAQMEGANKPKSSLDGKLESVIHKDAYPEANAKAKERILKAKSLYDRYRARAGEQLSGVDLMKRLGEPTQGEGVPKFHSTSHFAALPFMRMLERKIPINADDFLKKIYVAYEEKGWKLADTSTDGSLLYESRITDIVPTKDAIKGLREALSKIFDDHKVTKRPAPYYALLLADGDNMGKVIDNQTKREQHRSLSEKLSKFAITVPKTIEEHEGTTIYAGGDDILAYLPLHTALKCVKVLDEKFQKALKDFETKDGKKPTLSAGLVIAHHLTPLADVLEMARSAEKKAKDVDGKNGLAILSSKRSGEDKLIAGKIVALSERLETMTKYHRQKSISKGTAYELQKLHHIFVDPKLRDALQQEALRIVERKRESGSDKKIKEKVLTQFTNWLADQRLSVGELALEIMIATSFASAQEMAGIEIKEEEKEN